MLFYLELLYMWATQLAKIEVMKAEDVLVNDAHMTFTLKDFGLKS